MSILDRYIARQFIINVVVLLVILFSFVVAVDVSLNINRFVRVADAIGAQDGRAPGFVRKALLTVLVIADLWWPRLMQLFNFMLGTVMVAAMGFTCSQLSRHREFIAMLAAGISLQRVARPILVCAVAMLLLQGLNQELVIPRIAPLLAREHGDAGQRTLGQMSVPLTADGQGRIWRADTFDADADALTGIFVIERNDEWKAERVVEAETATWSDGGWDLVGGRVRAVGQGAPASGPDAVDRIETSLGPDELRMARYRSYRRSLSFAQVGRMLRREDLLDEKTRARLERIRYGRISMMFSSVLALMIAIPFYVTREPKNMVFQSLRCAPIAIVALMGGALGASAAIPGLPAAVGVFIPVMILTPVAIAMTTSIRS